ncbi:glycosyltransferase [Streptococcus suis]
MKICIVNCFDTYEHRVDLLVNYFSNKGDDVSVITSNYRHIEKVYRTESKDKYTFVDTTSYQKNMSYARLHSHWKLAKNIFNNLPKDIDLLWVLVPPNSFTKRAAEYKKQNSTTVLVFDIIDMWPETLPVGKMKNIFPLRLWRDLRDLHLNAADYIVTECNLYRMRLKNIPNSKISTLYLSYGDRTLTRKFVNQNQDSYSISICYLGSINNIIDIQVITNILNSLSKKYSVNFHLIGAGEKKDSLLSSVKQLNVNVIDHGKIYDDEKKAEILNCCHFGLNIMKKDVFVGLTMKSLDYFKNGIPIINNLKGDTWEFVENNDIGINTTTGYIDTDILSDYTERYGFVEDFYDKNFSEQKFYSDLEKILQKIMGLNHKQKI